MPDAQQFQLASPAGSGDYEVSQAECLSTIAFQAGHLWKTIWNHPRNAELAKLRDPHVLLPGDCIFIPPIRERSESAPTDQTNRFLLKTKGAMLRFLVKDLGKPLASQPYKLFVEGVRLRGDTDSVWKVSLKGKTDGQGKLEQPIPRGAKKGLLIVGAGRDAVQYHFELGTLDPINSVTGVQSRLANLGYRLGAVNGALDESTFAAIKSFCASNRISPPAEGQLSQEFCDTLQKVYGF